MKKCVKLLENLVENNTGPITKNLAYLKDRIAVFEGKSQLYGTQFDWNKNGELSPQRFDDLSKVNQRRKSIGLNSISEQTKIIRQQAKNENHSPPLDFEKKKRDFDSWRRKVGWTADETNA